MISSILINKKRFILFLFLTFCACGELLADSPTTIYTPQGSIGPDTYIRDEMSPSEIAAYNSWATSTYPNATLLSDASKTYNCHGYAWYVSEGGTHVWIGYNTIWAEDVYWQDNSYVEQSSEANGQKVSYRPDYQANHSAITTGSSGIFISKWGPGPLMQHAYNYCPYWQGGTTYLKYYKRNNVYGVPADFPSIASALSSAPSGWTVVVAPVSQTLAINLTGPSGVSITVKSGTTINLNGYYLRCTGAGVFNNETGSTINGLAASVQGANGGIYYTIQSAINCTPAGTIQLEARSYGESPSFSSKSNITLAGKGQGSTTIGSVSVTNSSYIGVSNLALSSLSLNNNNQTSIVNVTATSTSLAVDYGGTANTFNTVTANNLAASFGYTSYGGAGAFQPGCHIANGDCGIFLTNSASYTSSNDVFCCNGCDIDATGGAWAYSLNNTYSRPYPQSICGNVTCAGALDWVCGSQCEYRAMEGTASRLAKVGLDSLHDLDVQYLALLTRINDDNATGKYALANYLQDFQQLIDGYKTFLKGWSDKEIVKAALLKIRHLYRGMEDLDDFNAYVNACLGSGSFKPVESYFKRYLIWDQVDSRRYDNSITLADEIMSSPDAGEDLKAEMLYEKGLIYKYYLDDSSKAGEMYASLVSQYPSSPLTKLVEVETMTTPSYASNEPVQDSTRQAEDEAVGLSNYPNPFNPSTLISYTLHVAGYVSVKVYDALGREVATLVNSNQLPGFHSVTFDGSRSASGVYFYRLTAPGVNQVKKMLLVK